MTNSMTNAIKDVGVGGSSSAPTKIKLLTNTDPFYMWDDLDGTSYTEGSIAYLNLANLLETSATVRFSLVGGNDYRKVYKLAKEVAGTVSVRDTNDNLLATIPAADIPSIVVACIMYNNSLEYEYQCSFFVGKLTSSTTVDPNAYGVNNTVYAYEIEDFDTGGIGLYVTTYFPTNASFGSCTITKNNLQPDEEFQYFELGNQPLNNLFEFSVA